MIKFLVSEQKVSSVILWGRSMGASTAILYLSHAFRVRVKEYLRAKKRVPNYQFYGNLAKLIGQKF